MTTRAEREELLKNRIGASLRGLRKDPCLKGHLDAMEQADAEGLSQMVESLVSEIKRSGRGGGYLLELRVAASLFGVAPNRSLQCEQQGGRATAPGDIWLDTLGNHFEFQCKHLQNWSVELWLSESIDTIEESCLEVDPGRHYELEPTIHGDQADWQAFSSWVVENQSTVTDNEPAIYRLPDGTPMCTITFQAASKPGIHFGSSWSPGGVVAVPDALIRKKLNSARRAAEHTLSASPSATQFNCLVVDIDNLVVRPVDVFHALYGQTFVRLDTRTNVFEEMMNWDGLWYTDRFWGETLSALILTDIVSCDPLSMKSWVFPDPKAMDDVSAAFAYLPEYEIVSNYSQVDGVQ